FLLPLREKVDRQGRMRGVDATYSDFPPLDSSADEALTPLIRLPPAATFSLKGRRKRGRVF
ncbi:hypothetical protein, partial [Brevundimonas diminuta]|uniref:hypothetical protein n=1 Tax=Brevundimonas diminuta TaxID=293 RepID=UPI001C4F3EEB